MIASTGIFASHRSHSPQFACWNHEIPTIHFVVAHETSRWVGRGVATVASILGHVEVFFVGAFDADEFTVIEPIAETFHGCR